MESLREAVYTRTNVLRTKGERTRHAILDTAAALATQEGLESLSIARLAEATGMSKSGLFAHFGSKEELQLATVDHAAEIIVAEVIAPARSASRRRACGRLCDRMVDYPNGKCSREAASSRARRSSTTTGQARCATESRR
jgi:AcrR family transcriptional regulator